MRKDHLRVRVCSTLVLIFLFLCAPAGALGSWGLEVGRADAGDVAGLVSDWLSFKRERSRLDRLGLASMTSIARQKQSSAPRTMNCPRSRCSKPCRSAGLTM